MLAVRFAKGKESDRHPARRGFADDPLPVTLSTRVAGDFSGAEIERLGQYAVLGKLAKGGMAEVLLARPDGPESLVKPVIIKKLLPDLASDAQFVRMFLAEARLAALINHRNVVRIHELGEDPKSKSYYMVMEFVDGCTLKKLLRQAHAASDPLPLGFSARIIADVCGGLEHAHQLSGLKGEPLNLVHRDLTLENILVGFNGTPKLADFGIAKTTTADLTKAGQIKGKPTYMAPEQVLGRPIDRRCDIWALGVGLYWLASGRRPFEGAGDVETFARIVKGPLPPLPDTVDPRLAKIVARALEKHPDDRYGSARELGEALDAWLASEKSATIHVVQRELERRFPVATDPDRLRIAALLANEPAPVTLLNLKAHQLPPRADQAGPTLREQRLPDMASPTLKSQLEQTAVSAAAPRAPAVRSRRWLLLPLLLAFAGLLAAVAYLRPW